MAKAAMQGNVVARRPLFDLYSHNGPALTQTKIHLAIAATPVAPLDARSAIGHVTRCSEIRPKRIVRQSPCDYRLVR